MFQKRCHKVYNTPYTVVVYFSENTPYEKEAGVLKLTLDVLQISHAIYSFKSQGSWQKNTQFKGRFIQFVLDEFKDKPVLYLDADALVIQKPVLFDTIDCDIAAVHYNKSSELLSGTVYFANTPNCKMAVNRWVELNTNYPDILPDGRVAWDQRTLRLAIFKIPGIKFVELPQEYTWIVELTQKSSPGLAPVILHTRGAYRFQDGVK